MAFSDFSALKKNLYCCEDIRY